jgi:uncharacterized iron-regulated protein
MFAALAAMSLAAGILSARAASAVLPDLTSFALMRTGGSAPTAVSVDEAADALKAYDVIVFGEWHDHAGNHLAEMALFRALQERAPDIALSMEQFERDVQPVVDDYLAGRIGEEIMRRKGRAWGNYAESYRPLVEYAKEHSLAVIAANAPASVIRCVGAEGPEVLARLKPEQRTWAAVELHLGDGPYKDKFMRFLAEDGAHGDPKATDRSAGPTPADLRSFASQVTRDDTMAESIALHVQQHPGHKVVHITGAFHMEAGLGTVERLKARAPNLRIALVAPVEAQNPDRLAIDSADAKGSDFAFVLRTPPKEYVSEAEKTADQAAQRANFRMGAVRCAL